MPADWDPRAEYGSFAAVCEDQTQVGRSVADRTSLSQFFKACPGLEEVTLAFGNEGLTDRDSFPYTSYPELSTGSFHAERTSLAARSMIFRELALATRYLQRPPKRPSLAGVEVYDFPDSPEALQASCMLVRGVPQLSMRMEGTEDEVYRGHFVEFLRAAATACQDLNLKFPSNKQGDDVRHLFADAFGTIAWPQPRRLEFTDAVVDE